MKRKFTLLIAALALLTMIVQPGRVWGQESYSITYDVTAIGNMFASGSSYESANGYWKVPASAGNSAQINIPITYQPDSDITITFRIATYGGGTNPSASNTTITAIGTETNSNWSGTGVSSYPSSSTYVNGVMTISKPQDPTTLGGLAITMGVNSGIRIFRLQSIAVEYTYSTGGGDLEDNNLTLSPTSLALDIHNNPNTGTVTYTTSSTGAVTVSQSEYVTTSVSGNTITVTPVAVTPSEQTITVSQAADATYAAGSATFTVNVTNSAPTVTVTYHANGGTGDNIEDHPYQGSNYTVAGNTFTKSGYAFTKWHTNAAGTGGTDYDPGDVIENISDNIDLYAQWEVSYETVDVLDLEFTGRPASTSYGDWSDKGGTSGAVYAGNSAGDKKSIQLRTNNSNSGIITTTSAGNVTKVVVSWHGDTNNQRVLNVYGKNTPYESASDLYNSGTQGELLGTIAKSNQTTLEIDGSYAYIGLRSADGAMYLLEVSITWKTGGTPAPSITANNVEIDYDATAGSIAYEINNVPTPAGTLTATTTDTWLTLGTVGETVPFSCSTNSAATERTATVTLTYTYGDSQTVTKNVTVTQDGNPDITPTIAEVRAQGTGTVVTKGFVTSITGSNNKTAYIQDATAAIVVYGNFTAAVGDEIRVSGTLSNFNGLLEITSPTVTVLSSGNTINPQVMTIAEIVASENQGWYVRIEDATVTIIDGQNTTIAQDDNTIVVRGITGVEYAVDDVISLNGNIGCYNDVNQIANPQNVEVQQSTEPSITVANATVNVPAEGGEGTLTVTYENITTVVAEVYFCDAQGAATTYDWIVADINADNNVEYIVNTNEGEARTAYFKVYALDYNAEDVYSNLVTVNQDEYVVDYAELPFAFDGGRADIATTTGLTQEGLDTDYSSSPKLKFNGTGDWVILKINERPGTLTFDIKGNGFGNGSIFKLQTSADGTTYTDLKTYTELGATLNESFDNLGENVRYIKWIYTEKAQNGGNVALGNIALAKYTEPVPSISAEDVAVAYDATSGSIMYTINNYVAGTMVATTEADWISDFTYNQVDEIGEVGFTTAANTGAERSATVTLTYTYDNSKATVTKDVTVTQNGTPSITVTSATANVAFAGGTPEFAVTYESLEITKADDFDVKFYETPTSTTAGNQPSWITNVAITGNTTDGFTLTVTVAANDGDARDAYLKVYAAGSNDYIYSNLVTINQAAFVQLTTYSLVTSVDQIVSGKHYLFVGYKGEVAYAMGYDKGNNRNAVEVTVDNNTIPETVGAYEFVINNSGEDWTIYDNNVQELNTNDTYGFLYAAGGTSNNYLKTRTTNNDDKGIWTITIDDETHVASITAKSTGRNKMRFNDGNSPLFSCYSNGQKDIYLYVKDNDNNYEYYGMEISYEGTSIPDGETITVGAGSVMTVTNNEFGNDNPAALVIEDGGQLVFEGDGVMATMLKSTAHAGAKDGVGDWYTIASPLKEDVTTSTSNTNLTTSMSSSEYDLYRYNEATAVWENSKKGANSSNFSEIELGRGYLYWREDGQDLIFAGELNNENVYYTLTADGTGNLKGFNLIGNPFSQNITMANIDGVSLTGGYVLTKAGGWGATVGEIAPCQGFLVQVKDETNITISKSIGSKSRANRDYIAFTVANNQYEDVAYAMFSNGLGLDKIDHRNAEIPMVYIPQNGQNYAIATMSDDTEMFNLNFKAMTTGQYTLRVDTKGNYSYLHIYDKMTNEDVDMLLEGEYSFIGSPRDAEDRFVVRLSYRATIDGNDTNIFAYQSGSDIIVSGNGELQVFDVMGRMVATMHVNGVQTMSTSSLQTGLYIFRLNEKTQKIVVR